MIVTIVAIATIVQKFDWMIATILTIHGFDMIVSIAAVFMVECIKADDRYSVFTFVVTDSISFNFESIRSPFTLACYLFVFYETESHSNLRILFVQGLHQRTNFPRPFRIQLYFDSASYENIANFSLSFAQQLSFLCSSL